MSSPKSMSALKRLGEDARGARLRRGIAMADLAVRAGTSLSSVARLEKGDPGVAIGTLADVLVVLGLVERRSEEHTSELQSLMRISYAVFCLKKKKDPT